GHRVLEVGVEAPRFLLVDEVQGIEVADLARDPGGIPVGPVSVLGVGVELGDGPDARASLDEPRPELLRGVAERRERPEPGDDDATALHDQELSLMYWMASPTVTIFSASSSGIWMSKCSSSAMTSSTVSSESAPRSSMNFAAGVTSSSSTPSCSMMISFTLSSTDFAMNPLRMGKLTPWLTCRGRR